MADYREYLLPYLCGDLANIVEEYAPEKYLYLQCDITTLYFDRDVSFYTSDAKFKTIKIQANAYKKINMATSSKRYIHKLWGFPECKIVRSYHNHQMYGRNFNGVPEFTPRIQAELIYKYKTRSYGKSGRGLAEVEIDLTLLGVSEEYKKVLIKERIIQNRNKKLKKINDKYYKIRQKIKSRHDEELKHLEDKFNKQLENFEAQRMEEWDKCHETNKYPPEPKQPFIVRKLMVAGFLVGCGIGVAVIKLLK